MSRRRSRIEVNSSLKSDGIIAHVKNSFPQYGFGPKGPKPDVRES